MLRARLRVDETRGGIQQQPDLSAWRKQSLLSPWIASDGSPREPGVRTIARRPAPLALQVAVVYAVFGLVWVGATSLLLPGIVNGETVLARFEVLKGWIFVLLSTVVVYALARHYVRSAVASRHSTMNRFRALMDDAPGMAFWLSSVDRRRLEYVSPTIETLWGLPPQELYADPSAIREAVHPDDREVAAEARRAIGRGETVDVEYRTVPRPGEVRWVRSLAYPIRTDGTVTGVAGVFQDVTGRKRATEQLEERERLLSRAADLGNLGYWTAFPETGGLNWSEEVYRIFGVDPEDFDVTYERFLAAVHPEDRAAQRAADEALFAGRASLDMRNRIVRPDGEIRYVHEQASANLETHAADGHVLGIVQDVTPQVRLEEELRRSRDMLRRWAGRQTAARERERIDLAREIHDELGQLLTAVKLRLSRELTDPSVERTERARETAGLIDECIGTVRNLANRLRPPALDQLGLVDALAEHVRRFGDDADLDVDFHVELERVPLDDEEQTHLFRIVQEALTNVARHARADSVRVEIAAENGDVCLQVADDGVGIEADAETSAGNGLTGMRERAILLGGEIAFERRQPRGTAVRVRVPHAGASA